MKSIYFLFLVAFLTSCLGSDPSLNEAAKELKSLNRKLKWDVASFRVQSFRREKKQEMELIHAVLNSGVDSGIETLKHKGTDSIQKSKLIALGSELALANLEIRESSLKKSDQESLLLSLGQMQAIVESASEKTIQTATDVTVNSKQWLGWFNKSWIQESNQSHALKNHYDFIEKSGGYPSGRRGKRLANLKRVLELADEYRETIVQQVSQSVISDLFWAKIHVSAARSISLSLMASNWMRRDYRSAGEFPEPLAKEEEKDKYCIKAVKGDAAGTAGGSITYISVKCNAATSAVPPPTPQVE